MDLRLKNICKNYKLIVNCEFLEDDLFSKRLVEYYKQLVLSVPLDNENMIRKLARFDYVMGRYIMDYNFSRKLQKSIDVSSIINSETDLSGAVLDYVMDFSDRYDEDKEEIIINTRWI